MNARSELARTSRAAEPIAAPNAANAAPPKTIASAISPIRSHAIETNGVSASSITSVTAIEATTPSASFSARRPPGPTELRVTRVNAFSSRSRASEPATRSTVTNISVTVAAIETVNASSEVEPPETTSLSTVIGLATAPSRGSANSRFSSAVSPNSITRSSLLLVGGWQLVLDRTEDLV